MSDEKLGELRALVTSWLTCMPDSGPISPVDAALLLDEVDRLRAELAAEKTRRMQADVDLIFARRQRDEARRMWCESEPYVVDKEDAARDQGWDCYPEEKS